MEAAYAAMDDSPASTTDSTPDPVSDTPTDSAPAPDPAVASPPSDTGATPEKEPGPIPFARHKEVLDNARKEYEWLQQYGDTHSVRQKLDILTRAEQDPAAFARQFVAAANLNPAELFALQQQAAQAPAAPEKPAPDVLLENGQMVYSDAQLQKLLEWQQDSLLSRINQDIAPIKQQAAMAQLSEQATQTAKQELAAASNWPGFADAKKDIADFLRANPRATLRDAYIHVVPARLAEQAKAAETQGYQKALTELQTKAGAASAPAPRASGNAAPDTSRMSFRELLEEAARG